MGKRQLGRRQLGQEAGVLAAAVGPKHAMPVFAPFLGSSCCRASLKVVLTPLIRFL